MIGIDETIKIVNREYRDRIVKSIFVYGDNYLVYAPDKRLAGEDYSDPYFTVDRKSGEVRHFLPTRDISGFSRALRNGTIYKR